LQLCSGSFDVVLHNGNGSIVFRLNRFIDGVFVPKMVWRRMENFSTNSLALGAGVYNYNDDDYIRDYDEF